VSFTEDLRTVDIDLQYHFSWGSTHELVWGGGVRDQRDRTTGSALLAFVPADSRLRLPTPSCRTRSPLSERFKLTLGLKLEHNNYTGLEVQPNLRWPGRSTSASCSGRRCRARCARRRGLDRDLYIFVNLGPPYNADSTADPNFVSERLTAYELGYRAPADRRRTSFSVSAYYNDYDRLRSIEPDGAGAFVLGNKVLLRAAVSSCGATRRSATTGVSAPA
jgi:iron complex outermembrane receptor protein